MIEPLAPQGSSTQETMLFATLSAEREKFKLTRCLTSGLSRKKMWVRSYARHVVADELLVGRFIRTHKELIDVCDISAFLLPNLWESI
jgi:hypothetical protein